MPNGPTPSGLYVPTPQPIEPPVWLDPLTGEVRVRADLYAATRGFWDALAQQTNALAAAKAAADRERDAAREDLAVLQAKYAVLDTEHAAVRQMLAALQGPGGG